MERFTVYADEIEGRIDPRFYRPYFIECARDLQKSKFKLLNLKEVCTKITDGTHLTPKYLPSGIPLLSVKDIRENSISFEDAKFIAIEEHNKLIKRCKPEPEDVLLTKNGTVGLAAVIPKDAPEFSILSSVALLKVDGTKANPHYVCAYLNSRYAKFQIERALKGVGIPDLHLENIAEIKIPLPPIETQNRIVALMDKPCSQKKQKEAEAQKLLDSINGHFLDDGCNGRKDPTSDLSTIKGD